VEETRGGGGKGLREGVHKKKGSTIFMETRENFYVKLQ